MPFQERPYFLFVGRLELRAQTARDRLEIVIVAPLNVMRNIDKAEFADFLQFRIVKVTGLKGFATPMRLWLHLPRIMLTRILIGQQLSSKLTVKTGRLLRRSSSMARLKVCSVGWSI